jgi:hypothetical protein
MENNRIDQVILARIVRKFLHDITNVNGSSYMIFGSGKVLQPTRDDPNRLRLDVVRENSEVLNSMISRFSTHISDQIPPQRQSALAICLPLSHIPSAQKPGVGRILR